MPITFNDDEFNFEGWSEGEIVDPYTENDVKTLIDMLEMIQHNKDARALNDLVNFFIRMYVASDSLIKEFPNKRVPGLRVRRANGEAGMEICLKHSIGGIDLITTYLAGGEGYVNTRSLRSLSNREDMQERAAMYWIWIENGRLESLRMDLSQSQTERFYEEATTWDKDNKYKYGDLDSYVFEDRETAHEVFFEKLNYFQQLYEDTREDNYDPDTFTGFTYNP